MKVRELSTRSQEEIKQLTELWERSVRKTHDFLSEDEILKIKEYIPDALTNVHKLIVMDDGKYMVGFIGLEGNMVEMLFISPDRMRCGIGRTLLQYAIDKYSVTEVCVNEQNPHAMEFYMSFGFEVHKRTDLDTHGDPYPLLHMRLMPQRKL